MQRLFARAPPSWAVKLHAAWSGALVALPLGIAALAAAGYFLAAGYFYGRLVYSLLLVFGALMLYGLMALWVYLQHSFLLRLRAEAAAQPAAAGAAGTPASGIAEVPPPRLDIAAIGEQTRSLLDSSPRWCSSEDVGVWKDAVPYCR
jgi:small-conductance mechanosensitive channel